MGKIGTVVGGLLVGALALGGVAMAVPQTRKMIVDGIVEKTDKYQSVVEENNLLKMTATEIQTEKAELQGTVTEIDNKLAEETDETKIKDLQTQKAEVLEKIEILDNRLAELETKSGDFIEITKEKSTYVLGLVPFDKNIGDDYNMEKESDLLNITDKGFIELLPKIKYLKNEIIKYNAGGITETYSFSYKEMSTQTFTCVDKSIGSVDNLEFVGELQNNLTVVSGDGQKIDLSTLPEYFKLPASRIDNFSVTYDENGNFNSINGQIVLDFYYNDFIEYVETLTIKSGDYEYIEDLGDGQTQKHTFRINVVNSTFDRFVNDEIVESGTIDINDIFIVFNSADGVSEGTYENGNIVLGGITYTFVEDNSSVDTPSTDIETDVDEEL